MGQDHRFADQTFDASGQPGVASNLPIYQHPDLRYRSPATEQPGSSHHLEVGSYQLGLDTPTLPTKPHRVEVMLRNEPFTFGDQRPSHRFGEQPRLADQTDHDGARRRDGPPQAVHPVRVACGSVPVPDTARLEWVSTEAYQGLEHHLLDRVRSAGWDRYHRWQATHHLGENVREAGDPGILATPSVDICARIEIGNQQQVAIAQGDRLGSRKPEGKTGNALESGVGEPVPDRLDGGNSDF